MEASERHEIDQLPLEAGGAVRALGDRLVIEGLTVNDERAARLVRERQEAGQEPARTVRDAIEVGARVLQGEQTAANVDYVKRELQDGLGALNRELGETLEAGSSELAEKLAAAFGADRSDSVQQQIKALVGEHLDRRVGELTQLLSSEDPANPLVAIQVRATKAMLEAEERHRKQISELRESHSQEAKAMQEQVAGMRENLSRVLERQQGDELLAEAEEAGTRKGRSFEERVHDALERIAEARGDVALHTGDVKGDGGTKKGDTVIEVGAAEGPCLGRIVFEDKDRKISKPKMREELDGAMAEREAEFAVLVVAGSDHVPSGREELTEYEGNKLIISVDPEQPDGVGLLLAYRYARLRVLMSREARLEVDPVGVRVAAEAAGNALKRAQRVRNALASVERGAQTARNGVDEMVSEVEAQLDQIETLVANAADEG